MIAQNILNLTGLIVNIVGAYLMYRNAPPVNSQTFLYRDEEMKEKIKKDKHKNKMSRYGMFLLFIGFFLQFIALLINCLAW
jgi:hypothetical protein